MLDQLRRWVSFNRLMHVYWRFSRGLTLGVRALVLDAQGRVFLIKHTYTAGWQLPGGGVEAGETMLEALTRELREEGNIEMTGPPKLHGVFFHPRYSARDHVTLYGTYQPPGQSGGGGQAQETRTIVPDVRVLAITTSTGSSSGSAETLVTLALHPYDAELVVYTQEQGHLWMSLLPPNQQGVTAPPVKSWNLVQ